LEKVNSKILGSFVMIVLMSFALGAGTIAYFSDTETSNGNTFTAGTLDLTLDGGNVNVVKWTVNNFAPGGQPIRTFALQNVGSLTGYLDMESILVTEHENVRIDPEIEAGDTTDDVGELGSVVSINFFIDLDGNGWFGVGDTYIQANTHIADLPSHYELNEAMSAGETVYITAQVNWWSNVLDNQAQSDSLDLNITFELGQTTGQ